MAHPYVRSAVVCLAITLSVTAGGAATQDRLPANPDGVSRQDIKVHGRWTVEIRNADGSFAGRHEFDNALDDPGGGRVLAGLLGRFYRHIPQWQIALSGPPEGTCESTVVGCIIREHLGAGDPPLGRMKVHVPVFTVGQNQVIPSTGSIELAGAAQFAHAGAIQSVATNLSICRDTSCTGATEHFYRFTAHTLPTPIAVAANQIVQVTVVIRFS
jgi:hypothetical protein